MKSIRDPKNLNLQVEKSSELYFRGDQRNPKEIFEHGFQRKGGSYEYYAKHGKIQEPAIEYYGKDGKIQDPAIHVKDDDFAIASGSAICVTNRFDCAPIFPVDTQVKESWIYVVRSATIFPTHEYLHNGLEFALEYAARDIPSGDVLCAIKCARFWNVSWDDNGDLSEHWVYGMHYKFIGNIIWNPKLADALQTPSQVQRQKDIMAMIEKRKTHYVECAIPTADDKTDSLMKENRNSTPKILSRAEHNEMLALIVFGKIMDTKIPEQKKLTKAIQALRQCKNLNRTIPDIAITPLMLACIENNIEVVKYLLKHGAKKGIKNERNKTAYDFTTNPQIHTLLLQDSLSDEIDQKIIDEIDKAAAPTIGDYLNPFLRDRKPKQQIFRDLKEKILTQTDRSTESILASWEATNKSIISSHRNRFFPIERKDKPTASQESLEKIKNILGAKL